MTYARKPNKDGRIDADNPAVILLKDGNSFEAVHQFVNQHEQLAVYLTDRTSGIDARINLDVIAAVITSEEAAEVFDVDGFHGEQETELVADGGRVIESGDLVNHGGRTWTVARANTRFAELHAKNAAPVVTSLSDVEPVNGGEESW